MNRSRHSNFRPLACGLSGDRSMRLSRPFLMLALAAAPLVAGAAVTEDFEGVTPPALPDGWSAQIATGAASDVPWATVAVGYANSPTNVAWVDDVDDYADIRLTSPTYSLPASGAVAVTFHHSYVLWAPDPDDLDAGAFNGGVFEISVNGGAFQDILVAGGSFSAGAYDAALDPAFDSPLAQPPLLNRPVWSGQSADFTTTTVTLPASALGGTVAFRWRLGTEGGGRSHDTHSGWWLDDFNCDACETAADDEIFKDGFDGDLSP